MHEYWTLLSQQNWTNNCLLCRVYTITVICTVTIKQLYHTRAVPYSGRYTKKGYSFLFLEGGDWKCIYFMYIPNLQFKFMGKLMEEIMDQLIQLSELEKSCGCHSWGWFTNEV